ncbi:MAG: DUF6364 family protein [Cyclobacteriaceae bacterium]
MADSKITLSFDAEVIKKAKRFAASNNLSLSRLTEMLLRNIITGRYKSLEEFPIADWVNNLAEGEVVYKRKEKRIKRQFLESRK